MENNEIIKKWLNSELGSAERGVLENHPDYKKYKKIVEYAEGFSKPDFDDEKNLKLIQERIKNRESGKLRSLTLTSILKIAAVLIVVIVSGWFIYYNTSESINTVTGEISTIDLPDGSEVKLNAESKITYFPRKWESARTLSLEGEAFFQVEKGIEFRVETNNGTVIVLGTSFNVRNRPGFFEVTCYEGAVRVIHGGRATVLNGGQFYKVIEGNAKKGTSEISESPGWISEESSFSSVPLKFVMKDLERQFGITIQAGETDLEQLFTGSFSHTDMETALKSVTVPIGLDYRIEQGGKVVLYEE